MKIVYPDNELVNLKIELKQRPVFRIFLAGTIDNGNSIIFRYNGTELNYYRHACLDGYYERGCDYSANLCALSLYLTSNRFCDIITDLDEKLLVNGNDIL